MQSLWTPSDEQGANRARNQLDAVISATDKNKAPAVPRIPVAEARNAEAVVAPVTGRSDTRVLIITTDESLLSEGEPAFEGYLTIASVFNEVHVLVLKTGRPVSIPVVRVAPSVWLYVATATHRYQLPGVAETLIAEQFVFADGFRPDVIIARDPYESAVTAWRTGRRYDRATQLHLGQYWRDQKESKQLTRSEYYVSRFMIPRFLSIRTSTEADRLLTVERWPHIPDVAVLPRHRGVGELASAERSTFLREKYPQFQFVILYIGDMGHDSTAFRALDAVRAALQNPRVGMVMIGEGSARAEFMERAKLLGIAPRVVFEKQTSNVAAYLLGADVMLVTDTTTTGDDWCIAAGAAGTPVVATKTPVRLDVFGADDAILLTEETDMMALERGVTTLLNDNTRRFTQAATARARVLEKVEDNVEAYQRHYRDSIEQAIVIADEHN